MLTELNRRFGIPGMAEVAEGNGGLLRVKVKLPHVEGEMYLHGAHVTSWKPADTERSHFCEFKIALAGRTGYTWWNSHLLSLVPRQSGRSSCSRPWSCAHQDVANRIYF